MKNFLELDDLSLHTLEFYPTNTTYSLYLLIFISDYLFFINNTFKIEFIVVKLIGFDKSPEFVAIVSEFF